MFSFFKDVTDVNNSADAGKNPENTECKFSEIATEFETKSHSRIFGKMNNAPVGAAAHFTQRIIKLYINFNKLVDKQNSENRNEWDFVFIECVKKQNKKAYLRVAKDKLFK